MTEAIYRKVQRGKRVSYELIGNARPRNKPGNSLTATRNKAKARRKAQQKARRK